MAAGLQTVARKAKAKSEDDSGKRFGSPVRIADDVIADARVLASFRDVTLAELLSDTLRPIIKKSLDAEMRKRLDGGKN